MENPKVLLILLFKESKISNITHTLLYPLFFAFVVLGLCVAGKGPTTETHFQPYSKSVLVSVVTLIDARIILEMGLRACLWGIILITLNDVGHSS